MAAQIAARRILAKLVKEGKLCRDIQTQTPVAQMKVEMHKHTQVFSSV